MDYVVSTRKREWFAEQWSVLGLVQIRQSLPHVQSVIVSGKIDDQVSEEEISQSLRESIEADLYLHKPVSNDRLKTGIEELLGKVQSQTNWEEIAKKAIDMRKMTMKTAMQASKNLKKMLKKKKKK